MPGVIVVNSININDISQGTQTNNIKTTIEAFNAQLPVGTNVIGKVTLTDGTNDITVTNDSGTYRLEVLAKIAAGGASQDVHPVDTNGVDLDVAIDTSLPVNTRALLLAGIDQTNKARVPTVILDSTDSKYRMEIAGKITTSLPPPPNGADEVSIAADNPLDIGSGATDTDYTITSGKTITIAALFAGAEGDPTDKGSKVEVFYVDTSSVEHIIDRIYLVGATVSVYPDTSEARDGTSLNGTGTEKIRIRRYQFGGSTKELDAVVRGYEETT